MTALRRSSLRELYTGAFSTHMSSTPDPVVYCTPYPDSQFFPSSAFQRYCPQSIKSTHTHTPQDRQCPLDPNKHIVRWSISFPPRFTSCQKCIPTNHLKGLSVQHGPISIYTLGSRKNVHTPHRSQVQESAQFNQFHAIQRGRDD